MSRLTTKQRRAAHGRAAFLRRLRNPPKPISLADFNAALKAHYSAPRMAKLATAPSGLAAWLPESPLDKLCKQIETWSKVLPLEFAVALLALTKHLIAQHREAKQLNLGRKDAPMPLSPAQETELRASVRRVARAWVEKVREGGATLFDLEADFPEDGNPREVDHIELANRLVATAPTLAAVMLQPRR